MKKIDIKKICFASMVAVFFLLLPFRNTCAQNLWVTLPNGKRMSVNKNESVITYTKEIGKLKSMQVEDPKEVVKIIVMLKEKPLAFYKGKGILRKTTLTSVKSSLQTLHSLVNSKINNIAQQLSAKANSRYQYNIKREYYTVLNGMAMECNREMISYIRALPEVENVSIDGKMKINLKESVHQIGADVVQDSLGYKGDSIVVGEVDTGIDYMHPALGGGFGPQFRVIGGHDFANNDNNPMDDHGHGTHVAGIIGANGGDSLRGVAPHVKFLAVKVLDKNGSGNSSDVIAGIDYCLDPDGNPETDDAVDVINMSLGGSPDPIFDSVVNNVSAAGILSVVAAGNSGGSNPNSPHYQTIGTPGEAETALTVGACDSSDQMAPWSSKGPDPVHFSIKPEVVAPGVNILSTYLNNSTATLSGTSMAAPHVTGVAALLKQMHRNWTPEQMKAVIINSAKSLSAVSPYVQGSGRVSAINAAKLGLMIDKGVLNFGAVDLSYGVWKDTAEFKVKNLRNASQNIKLEPQNLPAYVTISLSQTNFSLSPMQEAVVTVIISVPHSVPILNEGPLAYSGNIVCTSDSDKIQVPFGFIKTNMVLIETDIQPLVLLFWNGDSLQVISTADSVYQYKSLMPAGIFNLYALLRSTEKGENNITKSNYYHIMRMNINTAGFCSIVLNHEEANINAFNTDNILDIKNQPVQGLNSAAFGFGLLYYGPHAYFWLDGDEMDGYVGRLNESSVYLSPMDTSIVLLRRLSSVYNEEAIQLQKYNKGATTQDDLKLSSGSENLVDFNVKFDYQPTEKCYPHIDRTFYDYTRYSFGSIGSGGGNETVYDFGPWFPSRAYLGNLFRVHYAYNKDPSEIFPWKYSSIKLAIGKEEDSNLDTTEFSSSEFRINDNKEVMFFERKDHRVAPYELYNVQVLQPGDTIYFNGRLESDVNLPVFLFTRFDFGPSSSFSLAANCRSFTGDGIVHPDGAGEILNFDVRWSGPLPPEKFTHKLFSNNIIVVPVPNREGWEFATYDLSTVSRCRLLAETFPYKLLGQSGQSVIDYEFNVTGGAIPMGSFLFSDIFPYSYFMHSLDLFQVLGDNKIVQWLQPQQEGKLRLVLFDPKVNVDSVTFSILNNDGTEIELAANHPEDKEYYASIPKNISEGLVDVIARAHNTDGNKFELLVSPAFYYGKDINNLQFESRIRMSNYGLHMVNGLNIVNPTRIWVGDTLKYTLTYVNYGNMTAKNLAINFPGTELLKPISSNIINIDSLGANDTCVIPVSLVLLKKGRTDNFIYYSPSVTWTSGSKSFTRKYKMLVDLSLTRPTGVETEKLLPQEYSLYNNYPNPFNPSTTISYSLPEEAKVKIEIFNLLGQRIATLVDGVNPAGDYKLPWNAGYLSSGLYFCKLKAEGKKTFEKIQKLVLIK